MVARALALVLVSLNLAAQDPIFDLRADYSAEAFPDTWRYEKAAAGSNEFIPLAPRPVFWCAGVNDGRNSWVDNDAVEPDFYASWLIVTDCPSNLAPNELRLHASKFGRVRGPCSSCVACEDSQCPATQHTDPVVAWVAPERGLVSVAGSSSHGTASPDMCGNADGLLCTLKLHSIDGEETPLWRRVITLRSSASFNEVLELERGDIVRFRANARSREGCDHLNLSLTFNYLTPFLRGDANGDGVVDISDAAFTLAWLFLGGPEPPCVDAADSNDSGGFQPDVSDSVYLLNWLFLGGTPLPAPGTLECGSDPTEDDLDCVLASCV